VHDENRDQHGTVVMISGILEFNVNRRPFAAIEPPSGTDGQRLRQVA